MKNADENGRLVELRPPGEVVSHHVRDPCDMFGDKEHDRRQRELEVVPPPIKLT